MVYEGYVASVAWSCDCPHLSPSFRVSDTTLEGLEQTRQECLPGFALTRTDQNTSLPIGNILQLNLDTSVYSEYISFQKLSFVAASVPAWLFVHVSAFQACLMSCCCCFATCLTSQYPLPWLIICQTC